MKAEIYSFRRYGKTVRTPVTITHDGKIGHVNLPKELTYKLEDESWLDFCRRLWIGVYEANGRDDIKLTVHMKLSESDKLMYELNSWAFYCKQVDGGALSHLVEERMRNLDFHGICFKFDIPE